MRQKSKKLKSKKNKKIKEISISATEVFEYVKCPAFFKHYINSGKFLNECYTEQYKNQVFSLGIEFESREVEKFKFAPTEKSLQKLLKDPRTSLIRIEIPMVLKRELPQNDYLKYYKVGAFATGRPDLLVKDEKKSRTFVPFEYKTSMRHIKSTKYQLLHYCFLLQRYDSSIPNIGFLQTKMLPTTRYELQKYKRKWENIVVNIELIKLRAYDFNQIVKNDLRWNLKECRQCYFNSDCHKFLRLNTRIRDLYQVGKSRNSMIQTIGIKTVEELANTNVEDLWKQLKAIKEPDAKEIFQQEKIVRKIVGNARAIIKGQPVPLYSRLEPFVISYNDAFFDLEYISKTPPTIFSVCLGRFQEDGKLSLKTWFAKNENEVETIIKDFYKTLKKSTLNRLMGWSINNADLPMLRKIVPPPDNIDYFDLYKFLEDNIALPILTYGLKAVSKYVFGNQSTDASEIHGGLEAVYYYNLYLNTRDPKYKRLIKHYNEQDVRLTFEVAKWIERFYRDNWKP